MSLERWRDREISVNWPDTFKPDSADRHPAGRLGAFRLRQGGRRRTLT